VESCKNNINNINIGERFLTATGIVQRRIWKYQKGNRNPNKDTQHTKDGLMNKQRFTKHYTENWKLSNTNTTKTGVNSCAPEGWAVPALLVYKRCL